jgi:hypothetical protein
LVKKKNGQSHHFGKGGIVLTLYIPDEGYSRNTSWALNSIYLFLFLNDNSLKFRMLAYYYIDYWEDDTIGD